LHIFNIHPTPSFFPSLLFVFTLFDENRIHEFLPPCGLRSEDRNIWIVSETTSKESDCHGNVREKIAEFIACSEDAQSEGLDGLDLRAA